VSGTRPRPHAPRNEGRKEEGRRRGEERLSNTDTRAETDYRGIKRDKVNRDKRKCEETKTKKRTQAEERGHRRVKRDGMGHRTASGAVEMMDEAPATAAS
jgi:hypothetical protein